MISFYLLIRVFHRFSGMASYVVITGANRGLGFELTRSLLRVGGYHICAIARSWASGPGTPSDALFAALHATRALPSARWCGLTLHTCDISSGASIVDAGASISHALGREGRVASVVNNAAVYASGWTHADFNRALDINLKGAVQLTSTLLPLMQSKSHVVNVSSGMGALATLTPHWSNAFTSVTSLPELYDVLKFESEDELKSASAPCYRLSKAALNAASRIQSKLYEHAGVRVNAVDPGWCRTDMGGETAPRSAAEGARSIYALLCGDEEVIGTGRFYDCRGKVREW